MERAARCGFVPTGSPGVAGCVRVGGFASDLTQLMSVIVLLDARLEIEAD
jgi:hypothetical protein